MSVVTSAERCGGGICFLHAVIRIMSISPVLMLKPSSNLACSQCFISSTAAIRDASQPSSLQHSEDLLRFGICLFPISSSPIWIFIGFKLDANDTSRNTPQHLEKVKLISCPSEIVSEFWFMMWIPQKDHVAPDVENTVQNIMQARKSLLNNKGIF